ncbi:MAG TPA: AraC family transcriptional regulator, partial [Chthoniobacterales bacterium]|nr:AraC family transcriptional regulator [Chthoniobacterales bacterium]
MQKTRQTGADDADGFGQTFVIQTREIENNNKELEALQKSIPYPPCTTSYGLGWKGVEAVRYRRDSAKVEFTIPPVSYHSLILISRPPENWYVRYEGVERQTPPAVGSIAVVPAGSSPVVRWQGSKDTVLIYLEPSLIARVAAESFEVDSSRTMLPPLYGLNAPELRASMLGVDAELSSGGAGGSLLAESFANVLAVHLIRQITGSRRWKAPTDGVLSGHKLRRVIEYIMENLEGNPTLEGMAAAVNFSPYHFARKFKAATGLAPHQFVITRRIERAQHLLRTNGELGLAEVAFRSG